MYILVYVSTLYVWLQCSVTNSFIVYLCLVKLLVLMCVGVN